MIKPKRIFPKFKLENAQTMVEFAIVFPIVLLLTYGLIEFGRMLFIYTAVTGSAREGARYGAAAGSISGMPQYANCAGIRKAVRSAAFLITIPDDTDIKIRYDKGPGLAVVASSCEDLATLVNNDADPIDVGNRIGYRILVQVTTQYEPMIGSFLGVSGFPIISQNARTILVNIPIEPYP
jgi:Flp pilus assembly protein TadG